MECPWAQFHCMIADTAPPPPPSPQFSATYIMLAVGSSSVFSKNVLPNTYNSVRVIFTWWVYAHTPTIIVFGEKSNYMGSGSKP